MPGASSPGGLPPGSRPPDGPPPMAAAMQWVSRVTTMSLSMALPAFGGYWLDQRWKTSPWLTIVGAVVGFAALMSQLLQFARQSGVRDNTSRRNP